LKNKVALITGAGRGIGAATARLLASRGVKVALMARTLVQVEAQASAIEKEFGAGCALALVGDVSDEKFLQESFARIKATFGPVSILVNNAGVLLRAPLTETSLADWEKVMRVNVTAAFLCSKYAIPQMREAGHGAIVNVSSLSGIRSALKFPGFSAYIASKHALVGLTEGLSVEVKSLGIRVNCIAPGAVDTQMLRSADPSLKTKTQPEEIAQIITYLCDDHASHVLTGSVIEVNTND
jgi:NAD(P)-dependent dehydrogenase (short-subunit alcohol dehydrogenase family)